MSGGACLPAALVEDMFILGAILAALLVVALFHPLRTAWLAIAVAVPILVYLAVNHLVH